MRNVNQIFRNRIITHMISDCDCDNVAFVLTASDLRARFSSEQSTISYMRLARSQFSAVASIIN
jgi:hypothetical protein